MRACMGIYSVAAQTNKSADRNKDRRKERNNGNTPRNLWLACCTVVVTFVVVIGTAVVL